MDDVKVAQDAALANVMSAVESALASAPAKRKPEAALPTAKRRKAPRHMSGLDGDLSSDSDEEPEEDADVGAAGGDLPLQKEAETVDQSESAARAGNAGGSGSSGSEQEALERPLHTADSVQVRFPRRSCADCLRSSCHCVSEGTHVRETVEEDSAPPWLRAECQMLSWLCLRQYFTSIMACIHKKLSIHTNAVYTQEDTRSVEDSSAPPSQMTAASGVGMTGVGSSLQTVNDSTELTVVASTAAAPETLQATAGPASDSQAASALKVIPGPWITCRHITPSAPCHLEA